jgi:hypothetical protein
LKVGIISKVFAIGFASIYYNSLGIVFATFVITNPCNSQRIVMLDYFLGITAKPKRLASFQKNLP